jgi:hypothetical protein
VVVAPWWMTPKRKQEWQSGHTGNLVQKPYGELVSPLPHPPKFLLGGVGGALNTRFLIPYPRWSNAKIRLSRISLEVPHLKGWSPK